MPRAERLLPELIGAAPARTTAVVAWTCHAWRGYWPTARIRLVPRLRVRVAHRLGVAPHLGEAARLRPAGRRAREPAPAYRHRRPLARYAADECRGRGAAAGSTSISRGTADPSMPQLPANATRCGDAPADAELGLGAASSPSGTASAALGALLLVDRARPLFGALEARGTAESRSKRRTTAATRRTARQLRCAAPCSTSRRRACLRSCGSARGRRAGAARDGGDDARGSCGDRLGADHRRRPARAARARARRRRRRRQRRRRSRARGRAVRARLALAAARRGGSAGATRS